MVVDLGVRSYKFYSYSWENGIYRPVQTSDNWEPIPRNKFLMQDKFVNNEEYRKELNDPGATFKHPIKGVLTLADIYMYPDFDDISGKETACIPSESVPKYIFDSKKLVILGEERSGKTCLLKNMYQYFRSQGIIPLLIDF